MSNEEKARRVFVPVEVIPREGKILSVVGWSGSGKTTLICALIPILTASGLTVSTLKHTHHDLDPDPLGKDSRRHRHAGAHEVILVGPKRAVTVAEWRAQFSPPLSVLLARLQPVDLVLIEGFKDENCPKIEVWRAAVGKPRAIPDNALLAVVMSAEDASTAGGTVSVPVLDLDDPAGVAAFLVDRLDLSRSRTTEHENSVLCMDEDENWSGRGGGDDFF